VATGISIALYTVHNLFHAGVSFPAGSLADRLAPRWLLSAGFLLWVLALIILAAGPTAIPLLALPFVLSGTATAIIEPVETTFAAQLLAPEARGRGLGLLSGLTGFGQLASGLIVGAIWTAFSAPPAFLVSTAFAIIGLIVLQSVPAAASPAERGGT
jgi:MFS family permease